MPGERITVRSSAVKEVAFLEPDTIFVVPASAIAAYRYDGFTREGFAELVNAPSVGHVWSSLLKAEMEARGVGAEQVSLDEYEALFAAAAAPVEYDFTGVAQSSYAW